MNLKKTTLNSLTDRINYALQLTGTKKADLARSINVKPQVIQFLCSGATQSSRFTFEIATTLGLNTGWLAAGEGEMFIADDPKQQFLNAYTKIPRLNNNQLKIVFFSNENIDEKSVEDWLPLQTNDKETFAIKMVDTSMEPSIPYGATVFIRSLGDVSTKPGDLILTYLSKFDTFAVRKITLEDGVSFLSPHNYELFNKVKINEDVKMLGVVTDCFWHIMR